MTERRCKCGHFYDKSLGACPKCGTEPPKFNKSLRTSQLNNHLYQMAERA